ncbi:uncharacterized protein LOC112567234 [Pomacea canaliculata]|uniref:uncharacterized protein LOC112567234 n=1 Tax=Pomacea canaliculata TaxID=400727 RepID=UPI000D738825|nr:uncharacterized protein LOC112567234 [Pomacea canaliculata]
MKAEKLNEAEMFPVFFSPPTAPTLKGRIFRHCDPGATIPPSQRTSSISAVSPQRGGPSQQHGTSPRFSPSPSLPPIKKKRAPAKRHNVSTVDTPTSSQRNNGAEHLTNLTVSCGANRFRTGLVVDHLFFSPLPRRKLQGSPERMLRSSKVSPRRAENIRACFARPQPTNPNVVFTRSLSPPFNYSVTREQNRRFLSMYTNARIY